MRRILLVLLVAAMMLALTAGAAFATGAPGGPDTANCQGAGSSQMVSGGGGLPGSNHDQVFIDPFTGQPTFNGPFTSKLARQQEPDASSVGSLPSLVHEQKAQRCSG
jgi:hypothetical protein